MVCSHCGYEGSASEFWVKGRRGESGVCKTCKREYNRHWYLRNKDKHISDVQKNNRRYEEEALREKGETKRCSTCHRLRLLTTFGNRKVNGKTYKKSRCRCCQHRIERTQPWYKKGAPRRSVWNKERRKNKRAYFIVHDSRRSDKIAGRKNDLDVQFVSKLIRKNCSYCKISPSETKMTLDRVDNAIGHTKDNVVQACIDCNYIRRNLPYEAWLIIAKGVRRARKLGLLGGWSYRQTKHSPSWCNRRIALP